MEKYLINKENDVAIFDVDRTLINTTSWYKACTCDDLLIAKENVKNLFKLMIKLLKILL